MKVLVCGGRTYSDRARVYAELDALNAADPIDCIVHGACSGADSFARHWATDRGLPQVPYWAEWHRYGNAAGPMRNQHMLDTSEPDLVVAFPGGAGTADMVRRARKAKVRVLEIA